jgi:methylthioribose-1-phosphate isomerase
MRDQRMLEPPVKPIEWQDTRVRVLDQRELPGRETWLDITTADQMAAAICGMALRGAPLVGIAAAMGVAVVARRSRECAPGEFRNEVEGAIGLLGSTRPTAVNLAWALGRMRAALGAGLGDTRAAAGHLVEEALAIYREDLETGRRMGEIGADLIKQGMTLLTHCNAGGLATSGYGTALAPMYVAKQRGVSFRVLADETRPLLQGARLTAWELARAGIDVTVICDSAAHSLIAKSGVDLVFVGADRITLSGDFANKIGTLGVALSAKAGGIPFYVVAPTSTMDFSIERGEDIPIEERDPAEVTHLGGRRLAPEGVAALNPAFDVTPAGLVTGIITEKGLITGRLGENLIKLKP